MHDDAPVKAPAVLLHGESESTRSTEKSPQPVQNTLILSLKKRKKTKLDQIHVEIKTVVFGKVFCQFFTASKQRDCFFLFTRAGS